MDTIATYFLYGHWNQDFFKQYIRRETEGALSPILQPSESNTGVTRKIDNRAGELLFKIISWGVPRSLKAGSQYSQGKAMILRDNKVLIKTSKQEKK
jgi:hypothetical protein